MKKVMIVLCLFFTLHLSATIINIPADQPTIQEGINASVDTDTVLVQPGTYVENINYNGKNITVASLFYTTQDTSYISQTIIDGYQNGSVVTFESGEDSTAVLSGFTITNGDNGAGGGIRCVVSNPKLKNLIISNNSAGANGGGICCYPNSSPRIEDVIIKGNSAKYGGGLYCRDNSHPYLKNVNVIDNHAIDFSLGGGGIYCENNASPQLDNVTIKGNSAFYCGGGMYIRFDSSPILKNVTICGNYTDNYGGGIYCSHNSFPIFDSINRCNIFMNSSGSGSDLYIDYECPIINVVVDTFTVLEPDNYFAYPINNFTFDIQNSKVEQVNHDLYVSPSGSDDNSGLSPDESLLTISHALKKIIANINNPHIIYLSNGIYSQSQTTEQFPINCKSFVSLIGENEAQTILDGEELKGILFCEGDSCFSIQKMTIQNGEVRRSGGGIYLTSRSSPSLENVIISENEAYYWGGGVCCEDNSIPTFNNVIIIENSAMKGGGLYCHYFSNPSLTDVTIIGNTAGEGGGISLEAYSDASLMNVTILENLSSRGGGLYLWDSSPILNNVIINDNIANGQGGGIYCVGLNIAGNFIFSSPVLNNVTISRNISLEDGGGIYCWECSNPTLLNCILWDNTPQEVYFSPEGDSISITISFSDVQNGEAGIVTNNNGIVNWLEGNIDAPPLFVDPENGNYHLSWTNYPLPDSTMSPCIDAGDPNSPLDPDGTIADMGAFYFDQNVGIEDPVLPGAKYSLSNYPNPFNPSTTIEFSIRSDSKIELSIYNIKGQKVKQLISNQLTLGEHSIIWKGDDDSGSSVSSGIYFYKLNVNGRTEAVKKCLLIK